MTASDRPATVADPELLRAVAEQTSDLVVLADADHGIRFVNAAGRALLGEDRSTLPAVVAGTDRARFTTQIMATAGRDGGWSGPLALLDRAGDTVPVSATVSTRGAGWSLVARDLRERGDGAVWPVEERERLRSRVALAPVGIWVADRAGLVTFTDSQVTSLVDRGPGTILGSGWIRHVHPDDRTAATRSWEESVAAGSTWELQYRLVGDDGTVRHVRSNSRPLHDGGGAVTGFLGTTVDVTDEERAVHAERAAASDAEARRISDDAAARLRATVDGLAAIVWEADHDADGSVRRFTFVSDRAEELLGHPARHWTDDPGFWSALLHPDDRDTILRTTAELTAAGQDHDLTYRVVGADGRTVWLHHIAHVVPGRSGLPTRSRGLAIDVTEQHRAGRVATLVAEGGRLLAGDDGSAQGRSAEDRLIALARLLSGEFGDGAIVSLIGPDGRARRLAVAHHDDEVERALLRLAPTTIPPPLATLLAAGEPVYVPVTEDLTVAAARDTSDADNRRELGARGVFVMPLLIGDELAGMIAFADIRSVRTYDPAYQSLAADLGRRAAHMLETERRRERDRHLQAISSDLAGADGEGDAARRLVERLTDVLGAGAMSVYLVEPDRRSLRIVYGDGYAEAVLTSFATIRMEDRVPLAAVARTGRPIWLRDRADWAQGWPHLLEHAVAGGRHAAATLPLTSGGVVIGAIGMSFATPRTFAASEREFVSRMVAQAGPALERAATTDERRRIADTLQHSLLPAAIPALDGLAVAARYRPGAHGTQAGGDWYDIVPLAGGRVAVVVGDVVGQGARAAAVMGQLRSALSAYLLEGHSAVRAVELLDAFGSRIPGAVGSTLACVVLDPASGEIVWARAGHPDPLLTGSGGARYLDDAAGTVLGVSGRPPFRAGTARMAAGESLVLYTDGLVERRTEDIDIGFARLHAAGTAAAGLGPDALADALLSTGADPAAGGGDDVALLVVRLLPPPLDMEIPVDPRQLRQVRQRIAIWAAAVGLDPDALDDLQFTVGEAAANAIEHAYRDLPPGRVRLRIAVEPPDRVSVRVEDTGRWRVASPDPGHRGRGLAMIRQIARDVRVVPGDGGTRVEFAVPTRSSSEPSPARPPAATWLRVDDATPDDDTRRVEVLGDLDLEGAHAVRTDLLALCGAAGPGIRLDLRATTFLTSAGAALLLEAADASAAAGRTLRVLTRAGSGVHRFLSLHGAAATLGLTDT